MEYVLTATLMGIALIVALTFLGNRLTPVFSGLQVQAPAHTPE